VAGCKACAGLRRVGADALLGPENQRKTPNRRPPTVRQLPSVLPKCIASQAVGFRMSTSAERCRRSIGRLNSNRGLDLICLLCNQHFETLPSQLGFAARDLHRSPTQLSWSAFTDCSAKFSCALPPDNLSRVCSSFDKNLFGPSLLAEYNSRVWRSWSDAGHSVESRLATGRHFGRIRKAGWLRLD
jgi:hypothetical protein